MPASDGDAMAARANSHGARTPPALGERCAAGIVSVSLPFMGSAGSPCEYSSAVDDIPMTAQLIVG